MILSLFLENIHEKPLEFGRMHEGKNIFFCFWKEEINLNIVCEFFLRFFQSFGENQVFLISSPYLTV